MRSLGWLIFLKCGSYRLAFDSFYSSISVLGLAHRNVGEVCTNEYVLFICLRNHISGEMTRATTEVYQVPFFGENVF